MKRRGISVFTVSVFGVLLVAVSLSVAQAKDYKVICGKDSIQSALNKALGGDRVVVSGECTENVTMSRRGVTLMGADTSSKITGATHTQPVINVRGAQNVTIRGLILVGADDGAGEGNNVILVQRSAAAIIASNDISNGIGPGSTGVLVTSNSYARIGGFTIAERNTIHANNRGINVRLGSGSDIFFNDIDGNFRGISLSAGGSADISDNHIRNSTERGVSVSFNGVANFSGSESSAGGANTFEDNPIHIRCTLGGAVSTGEFDAEQIYLGTGVNSTSSTCHRTSFLNDPPPPAP